MTAVWAARSPSLCLCMEAAMLAAPGAKLARASIGRRMFLSKIDFIFGFLPLRPIILRPSRYLPTVVWAVDSEMKKYMGATKRIANTKERTRRGA